MSGAEVRGRGAATVIQVATEEEIDGIDASESHVSSSSPGLSSSDTSYVRIQLGEMPVF